MTNTYNTLNPLGSTSPKDLFDNASNFDDAMNSPAPSFYDRFNLRRETWSGMQKQVADFLEAMGFEATHLQYADGFPLTVLRPTQLIDRAPSVYKVKQPAVFPVNLTGTWATDQLLLVDVGDASLRSDLASTSGATMVGALDNEGFPSTVQALLSAAAAPITNFKSVRNYGAVGDGLTDDTQAFKDALAAALAAECSMFIPAGLYLVSGDLNLGAGTLNLCVYGEGRASRIKYSVTSSLFHATGLVGEMSFKDFIIDNAGTSVNPAFACFDFPEGNTNTDFTNVSCLPDLAANKTVPSFYVCGVGKTNDSVNFINCYVHTNKKGIQTGAGSSVYIIGGRIIGFDPLTENSVGVAITGGMGGVWIISTDIIGLTTGVSVSPTSGASNREVFLNGACIDSCFTGLYVDDAASYVGWTGVWAASCYLSNINYAPTSDAAVLNLSGGTVFNAGSNDAGTTNLHYGLSLNQYGRVLATGITFRNNKNRGVSCNSGARASDATISGCTFFSNGTNGRATSTQVLLAGQVVFQDNAFAAVVGVPNVTVDAGSISAASIRNNRGYKGVALRAIPPITGSNVDITNSTGQAVTVFIRGGSVSSVSLNGSAIYDLGSPGVANLTLPLEPLDVFRVVYTAVPDMQWKFE